MISTPRLEAVAPTAAPSPRLPTPDSRLRQLAPAEGWLAFAGFAAAAEAMAGSVAAAGWQPGLSQLPLLVGLAIGLGFLFTRGRRQPWALHLLAIAIGLVVASRVAGTGFLPRNMSWQTGVYTVLADLSNWVSASVAGRITQDNLLIVVAVGSFLFVWTYAALILAMQLRQAWVAAGLLGGVLFANVLLKPQAGAGWLALWAGGSLVLILRIHIANREWRDWTAPITGWQSGNRLALSGGLVIAAFATAVFSTAPQVHANQRLNDLYQKLNGPICQAQRAYDAIGVPQQVDASQVRYDSFQQQLRFLGPFEPGNSLVLRVASDRARYEQGLVFDHYDHVGWTDTRFNQFQFNSSDFLTLTGQQQTAHDADRQQVSEQITMVSPKGALLFAPPQPVGANLKLKGDGFGNLRATQVVQANQTYTSNSLESTATAESLASAAGAIPDDVRTTFLQLPADMPARVAQLAQQQTAGRLNAFDKATALEAYLRTFAFDTHIPPPPADCDAVDWFLFDERRGYCDYTSSAMAVMLRSLGIPARVAAGYSPGTLDPMDGTYHVTEQDTHTWTQAYFPGYGWIDFEPTANNPLIPRSHDPKASPQPSSAAANQEPPSAPPSASPSPNPSGAPDALNTAGAGLLTKTIQRGFPWLWLFVAAAVLGGAAWFGYSRWRGSPSVTLAYARVALSGTLMGLRRRAWQTPAEYGRELQDRRRFDPSATTTIVGLYAAHRFGRQPLDERSHHRAWTAWRYLRGRLLRPWRRT